MADLRNTLLFVISLSLGVVCAPVRSDEEKVEVHCISDYRQYCKGKPNGLTFSDGCRECKCEKGSVLCRKGGCSSFAKADEDIFNYCDSINLKNAQALKKMREVSKLATKSPIATKIDLNSSKPDELTESEKDEATAKIQKLFNDYMSGMTTETSKVYRENSEMAVDRENENFTPNMASKPGSRGFQQNMKSLTSKTPSNAPFKSNARQQEDNFYKLLSKRLYQTPPRDRLDDDDELVGWPYQSEIRHSPGRPIYLENRWPPLAAEYDIFAPRKRLSRRRGGGRSYYGLVGARGSYWNNQGGTKWNRDTDYHKYDIYRLPRQYHDGFDHDYLDNYQRLPYALSHPLKENSIGQNQSPGYDNAVNVDENRQPKYDYVERAEMESVEKEYQELVKDITSFTILNRMAVNLLASENASYSKEKAMTVRNSTEFKYTMAALKDNLDLLEAELKEIMRRSDDEKLEFFGLVPHLLVQLKEMTKKAKAALRDSADPSESLKNQQLEGILIMMDDAIEDISKTYEAMNKKYHELSPRMERLAPLDEFADYANEIIFLKRKLAQCMKRCSNCS